jgi:hypothetical protein
MTISMYSASVPVFRQMLAALADVLAKASVHAAEKKIEPGVLLQARLYPDMFPLLRQAQIASDFAKGIAGRVAGAAFPADEDNEQTFDELQARIAKTLAFLDGLDPKAFEGAESRQIVLRPGTPKERSLDGHTYLAAYGLPQFFFHVATAYGVLRHCGVEIGKRDYMGNY